MICGRRVSLSTNPAFFVQALSNGNHPHSKLVITSEKTSDYYKLMAVPYESASADAKSFWLWLMKDVMPYVSSEWKARKARKGIQAAAGGDLNPFQEKITDYLSVSDFAYVPVVIEVYGKKETESEEVEQPGGKRSRGRMRGQSGLACKDNISKYIQSFSCMKKILEGQDNLANVLEWSDAALEAIDSSKRQQEADTNESVLGRILEAGEQAKRDIKRLKNIKS